MTNIRLSVPPTADEGEVIEIKAMIQHPMESGYRRGSKGEVIERNIITRFECEYDGNIVFASDFFPAVAANPFISFYIRASVSGSMRFRWIDQHGEVWSETAELTVT